MKTKNNILGKKYRPLFIGLFTVLAVIVLGVGLAYATGMTRPEATHADVGGDNEVDQEQPTDGPGPDGGGLQGYLGDNFGGGTGDNNDVTPPDDNSQVTPPDTGNDGTECTNCGEDATPPDDNSQVTPPDTGNDGTECTNCGGNDATPPAEVTPPDTGNDGTECTNCGQDTTPVTPPDTGNDGTECTNCGEETTPPGDTTPPQETTPPVNIIIPPTGGGGSGGGGGGTPPSGGGGSSAPGAQCEYLTASATEITPGEAVVLTWATENATSFSISGVGNVTPISGGSVTVYPTQATTYIGNALNATGNSNCYASVTIQTTGGGGGGGTPPGGGGSTGGSSGGTVYGGGGGGIIEGSAPSAGYVTLTQIPYTGLDLGPIGTVVYWGALIVFCGSATYLTLFNLIPFFYRRVNLFGTGVEKLLNQPVVHATGAAAGYLPAQHAAAQITPAQAAPLQSAVAMPMGGYAASNYTPSQGFKSFAASGSALTIDDIVKGLSKETGTPMPVNPYPAPEEAVAYDEQVVPVGAAHTNAAPAYAAPAQTRAAAQSVSVSTDTRDFVAALLNGDRDTVFGAIRTVVREGGNAEEFLTQIVCALDDAYRARIDGTSVNPEIAALTQSCATPFLEKLISALTNAVDSSYSVGITGAKLAATRALAVVEG